MNNVKSLSGPIPEWRTIIKRAIHSLDAHLIKLAYVCSKAEELWKGDDSVMYR